jgi:hypothetical protein
VAQIVGTAKPAPRFVVRGVDGGCRRVVIAKLRERGLDQDQAAARAEVLLPEAIAFWQSCLERSQSGILPGQDPELPYSQAFADLAAWAGKVDLVAASEAVAPEAVQL